MKSAIAILLICISFNLLSQNREVDVSSKYSADKEEYVLTVTNNTSVYKTVVIKFNRLSNLDPSTRLPAILEVAPGASKRAIRLTKSGIGTPDFSYSYTHYSGCARPKHDDNVIYALPTGRRKTTQPIKLTSLGNFIKNDEVPEYWNAIGFKMEAGDTIFCSRRGIVEKVFENSNEAGEGVTFTTDANRLVIRHSDCTFGRYANFERKGIFVKVGQEIEVGEPLGIVNGTAYGNSIHVRQMFFATPIEEQIREGKTKIENIYFPITYQTLDGKITSWDYDKNYESTIDENIITQEMSKREIKKWLKEN